MRNHKYFCSPSLTGPRSPTELFIIVVVLVKLSIGVGRHGTSIHADFRLDKRGKGHQMGYARVEDVYRGGHLVTTTKTGFIAFKGPSHGLLVF